MNVYYIFNIVGGTRGGQMVDSYGK